MYPRIKVSRVCFYDSHHIKKPLWVAAIIVGAVVDKQVYQFAARLALLFALEQWRGTGACSYQLSAFSRPKSGAAAFQISVGAA